jgi:hypothetical protein
LLASGERACKLDGVVLDARAKRRQHAHERDLYEPGVPCERTVTAA